MKVIYESWRKWYFKGNKTCIYLEEHINLLPNIYDEMRQNPSFLAKMVLPWTFCKFYFTIIYFSWFFEGRGVWGTFWRGILLKFVKNLKFSRFLKIFLIKFSVFQCNLNEELEDSWKFWPKNFRRKFYFWVCRTYKAPLSVRNSTENARVKIFKIPEQKFRKIPE